MTRQEAIQEQIDEIMDTFDFEGVHAWMTHSDRTWANMDKVPEIYEIRQAARERLKQAAAFGYSCTGGFTAELTENEDENGPWLKLDLTFGLMSFSDGTSYTK
jgi:hypothetical protein